MLIKPIHRLTYYLGIITGVYAIDQHNLGYLILSITFFFYAYMSCDTIEVGDK